MLKLIKVIGVATILGIIIGQTAILFGVI